LVALDLKTGKEKQVLFGNDSLNVVDAKYSKIEKENDFVTCEPGKSKKFILEIALG